MRKSLFSKTSTCMTLAILACGSAYSQADTANANTYESLSLKDLLNIKIVSVSKKSEFLFDAPLSASVVTKEDIRRTGCTSIMEALRLVPGMIVREQSNGNYDIHLRVDNAPPNSPFELGANTTMLIMIDNRIIYNYLKGGTFWETLPVDLNDVEKIEVVRGPAAALYGANAVNGVVNIITRQLKKEGLYAIANAQQGSNNTFINNASIGYKWGKLGAIASGNFQARERTQTSWFEFYSNKWVDNVESFTDFNGTIVNNVHQLYPDPSMAMNKYAGNLFLNYDAAESIKFNLSTGVQHSVIQRASTENRITPLSTSQSDSRYIDFRATAKGISAQLSYNNGTQIINMKPGNKYDFNTFEANIEYNYTKGHFSVKPGISYSSAIYDDTKYSDIINKTGLFNARGQITTTSASLRGEYKLLDNKLRLIAGLRTNKFNYPDTTYLSYQFAGTYKANKQHLFRVVYSQAPRSSNIYDTYVDQVTAFFPSGFRKFTKYVIAGNKNIKLLTANMFEIGYRGTLTSRMNIDVELFTMCGKNYKTLVEQLPATILNGTDTIIVRPLVPTNLPLKLRQWGITVSLTYNSPKLQLKPFVTLQETRLKNYAAYNNAPGVATGFNPVGPNNIYSGIGTEQLQTTTPPVFGGVSANYLLNSKINVNMSAYYYSSQTHTHLSNIIFHDGVRGIDHIPGKLILNANISYEAMKGLRFFCTGKNILNDRSREFFKTDDVPFMLLGGISYEF